MIDEHEGHAFAASCLSAGIFSYDSGVGQHASLRELLAFTAAHSLLLVGGYSFSLSRA